MRILFILFLLTTLVACSTASSTSTGYSPSAVVSVLSPSYTPRPGARFGWLPNAEHFYDDPRLNLIETNDAIQAALRSTLESKGYRYSPTAAGSDLVIAYAIALESSLSDDEVARRYGIQPGLTMGGGKLESYDKGTLIVRILDPASMQAVWRGAIQAGVTLQADKRERQQRLNGASFLLLKSFPAAG